MWKKTREIEKEVPPLRILPKFSLFHFSLSFFQWPWILVTSASCVGPWRPSNSWSNLESILDRRSFPTTDNCFPSSISLSRRTVSRLCDSFFPASISSRQIDFRGKWTGVQMLTLPCYDVALRFLFRDLKLGHVYEIQYATSFWILSTGLRIRERMYGASSLGTKLYTFAIKDFTYEMTNSLLSPH